MANRRLAPTAEQPESFAFTPENAEWARQQIAKYPEGRQASAVIPLLWRAQEQNGGWLPQKAIEAVADQLGMPHIRVLEVATFYTMFALEPVGRYWIQVCGTVPCDVCGAKDLKRMLEERLGPSGHVSPDGTFSWIEVECLGACCNAPMVQINHDYYEDLTPESLSKLMDDLAAGRPVKTGSQIGRTSSEPLGAVTTLTDETLFDGSRIGAWRKRFEEEHLREAGADTQAEDTQAKDTRAKTEGATAAAKNAAEPKPAKPDSGRATESPAAAAPAQRVAEGKAPVDPAERAGQARPDRTTVAEPKSGPEPQPGPQSGRSYTETPSKPGEGRPVAEAKGSAKRAGAEPNAAPGRTNAAQAKPVGADPGDKGPPGPGSKGRSKTPSNR
ncbi:NADH-quinone oxidoreductase subunit NuoE [Methylobacterium nodulans]|uniref:NADH-quinone oxidoreductase, E subunit n=1 Tax=Methylobacterium nodulans (strain LMG 21967 / CNCM I-2342 / ORS 2060) TaxID=460265 RepID=B8IUV0_METNO|nr:NADH-quinone oxidoreductase subunit NuoE [Methylobacterium nodulans]ACL59008.1 NADH-quinone oxidoreductase, E subunit [Methylobacterium nodulans ORS 2060]